MIFLCFFYSSSKTKILLSKSRVTQNWDGKANLKLKNLKCRTFTIRGSSLLIKYLKGGQGIYIFFSTRFTFIKTYNGPEVGITIPLFLKKSWFRDINDINKGTKLINGNHGSQTEGYQAPNLCFSTISDCFSNIIQVQQIPNY